MAQVYAGALSRGEKQRLILVGAGLFLLLALVLAGSLLLLLQFRDVRCYRLQQPFTSAESKIVRGNLLDCAVVNCRMKVNLGSQEVFACYFRLASQPLPIFPDEGILPPVIGVSPP